MTSHSNMALNNKGKIPWYLYFVGGVVYTAVGCLQNRRRSHGCVSSVRRWGFSMPGKCGNKIDNTATGPNCARRLRTASLAEGDDISSPRRDLSSR